MLKIVMQHDEMDCGAACFNMIANHFGYKISLQMARNMTLTGRNGTSVYNIVNAADKIGIKSIALQGSIEELVDLIITEHQTPLIAHLKAKHYIVIEKFKNGFFYILDPEKGKYKITYDEFEYQWSGRVITFRKESNFKKTNHIKNKYALYLKLMLSQWKKLLVVLGISVTMSIISILGTYLFQSIISNYMHAVEKTTEVIDKNPLELLTDRFGNSADIYMIFSIVIVLYLFQCIIQYFRSWIISWISKSIDTKLISEYYIHLQMLPLRSLNTRTTGDYISRFSDMVAIRDAISGITVTLIFDTFMMIIGGWLLIEQSWYLFRYTVVMVLLYLGIVLFYNKRISKINQNVMEKNAKVQSFFKESIDGAETIKSNNATRYVINKFIQSVYEFIGSIFIGNKCYASEDALVGVIDTIGTTLLIGLGYQEVLHHNIELGELVTFYLLLGYFVTPVKNLVELQPAIQKASVSIRRLDDILEMETEANGEKFKRLDGIETIEFRNVRFSYDGIKEILCDLSIKLNKGEKVALIGKSGSGKSTLAKLLLGLYQTKNIYINGCVFSQYSLSDIREKIAYISPETFLFSDTIRNNILLGNKAISNDKLNEVCEMCGISKILEELPYGLETVLDENGMNLSSGQKQKIAIARMLVRKPEVVIFDEATCNLDKESESEIGKMIFGLEKTMCIIISHRSELIKECGSVYCLENGRIEKR